MLVPPMAATQAAVPAPAAAAAPVVSHERRHPSRMVPRALQQAEDCQVGRAW